MICDSEYHSPPSNALWAASRQPPPALGASVGYETVRGASLFLLLLYTLTFTDSQVFFLTGKVVRDAHVRRALALIDFSPLSALSWCNAL
jgi:hypothetical protein